MHEDHPTPSTSIINGNYAVKGNEIEYTNLIYDSEWYKPRPFSKFFLVEGDFLYFANLEIQTAERDRTEAKWVYKLIKKELTETFKKYKNPLIYDHTPPLPYRIRDFKIYQVVGEPIKNTFYIGYYVVDSSYKAYESINILNVLKQMKYYPKSETEAENAAVFVFKAEPRGYYIFLDYTSEQLENWKLKSHYKSFDWKMLLKPFVTKKEDYFEVILYGYEVTPDKIHKFTLILGKDSCKLSEEIVKNK